MLATLALPSQCATFTVNRYGDKLVSCNQVTILFIMTLITPQSASGGLSAVVEDSLCDAELRPKAQKVCGEEDGEDEDSGDEGETTEPKVS